MISIVLATHNEAKNITACLEAVQKLADEIIVVDGESTDQTVALAKKLGAKVISTTNKKNFHINKQMGMDKAKGELVLQLDADEIVDPELAKFIEQLNLTIKNLDKKELAKYQPKAWYLKRKNLFLGKFLTKGGQYPDPVIRLYINGYAKLPQKDVHEQMSVDGEISTAQGHLLHYSNPTFNDYLRKFNTYTSFKAQQLYEQKIKLNPLTAIQYLLVKPFATFISLFIRHKGFMDKIPGFVFAAMSGLYWALSYLKLWEIYAKKN
jgi:glycosyltransferase involved in cell wall biosynthesis